MKKELATATASENSSNLERKSAFKDGRDRKTNLAGKRGHKSGSVTRASIAAKHASDRS